MKLALLATIFVLTLVSSAGAEPEGRHPRLLLGASEVARVRERVARDVTARAWYLQLRDEAVRLLAVPPLRWHTSEGDMLEVSREALRRVMTLAFVSRVDGDLRFARRARAELLAVAAFPDWNPTHFLDTAEMCNAVGLGYDWLYDTLSADDRAILRRAIVHLALEEAVPLYRDGREWTVRTHNWNLVCNGGLVAGALAIRDEAPEIAQYVVDHAVPSAMLAMATYRPDGGWPEGPGYWDYATRYAVEMMAALDSANGDARPLSAVEGLAETGLFRLHFTGPSGRVFNYADAEDEGRRTAGLFWLARRFGRPLYAWEERHAPRRPQALDLLWYVAARDGDDPSGSDVPCAAWFRGVGVVFMRTGWGADATWIGVKGGDNRANHGHLDLGTFVLEAQGERWAIDLGPDEYSLPGYFERGRRFGYYRTSTRAHNTVTVGGDGNQDRDATAPVVGFDGAPADRGLCARTVIDLSRAWPAARRVWRGVALYRNGDVLLQDEIEGGAAVTWRMLTRAEVRIEGTRATLRQGGKEMYLEILSSGDVGDFGDRAGPASRAVGRKVVSKSVHFEVGPATPASAAERPNTGVSVLSIAGGGDFCVRFSARRDAPAGFPMLPLSAWIPTDALHRRAADFCALRTVDADRPAVADFNGAKHRVMTWLGERLGHGHDEREIVGLLGCPDAVARPGDPLFGEVAPAAGVRRLLIYAWRGYRDFLYFAITDRGVVRSGWYFTGESRRSARTERVEPQRTCTTEKQ